MAADCPRVSHPIMQADGGGPVSMARDRKTVRHVVKDDQSSIPMALARVKIIT